MQACHITRLLYLVSYLCFLPYLTPNFLPSLQNPGSIAFYMYHQTLGHHPTPQTPGLYLLFSHTGSPILRIRPELEGACPVIMHIGLSCYHAYRVIILLKIPIFSYPEVTLYSICVYIQRPSVQFFSASKSAIGCLSDLCQTSLLSNIASGKTLQAFIF